jgi:hypothetical protein
VYTQCKKHKSSAKLFASLLYIKIYRIKSKLVAFYFSFIYSNYINLLLNHLIYIVAIITSRLRLRLSLVLARRLPKRGGLGFIVDGGKP